MASITRLPLHPTPQKSSGLHEYYKTLVTRPQNPGDPPPKPWRLAPKPCQLTPSTRPQNPIDPPPNHVDPPKSLSTPPPCQSDRHVVDYGTSGKKKATCLGPLGPVDVIGLGGWTFSEIGANGSSVQIDLNQANSWTSFGVLWYPSGIRLHLVSASSNEPLIQ